MLEPTLAMAILSGIGSVIFAIVALAGIILLLAEEHRTKRYPTKNEWAYGDKRYGYEIKFITGGKHGNKY